MKLTTSSVKTTTITVSELTSISGASVLATFQGIGTMPGNLTLDPADAFAIGDALKAAARQAGYVPPPAP